MPSLTLVYPSMGRGPGGGFVKSWRWEPLAMGVLAALTPARWRVRFFDDRVEKVDYSAPADLAAISVEAYSARRAYQIAARFRERGTPVVFGGFHATARPQEALEHGDAVCVGEAEGVWQKILWDAERGRLEGVYRGDGGVELKGVRTDRRIFEGKGYLPVALVESARGCPFQCSFCSISAFFGATYRRRPPKEVADEMASVPQRHVFLVDDNFSGNLAGARALMRAIAPTRKRWLTQTSLAGLEHPSFVAEMAHSGCLGVLIGFESLLKENLEAMNKGVNRVEAYAAALKNLRREGIFVYGTFLFGYPHDTADTFAEAVRFAVREKMFIAAFNHLVPFPGTPLYDELEEEGRLSHERWWLSEGFRFGQVPFAPASLTAREVEAGCLLARREFYRPTSILRRASDFRCNCRGPVRALRFLGVNLMMGREVNQKRSIALGQVED